MRVKIYALRLLICLVASISSYALASTEPLKDAALGEHSAKTNTQANLDDGLDDGDEDIDDDSSGDPFYWYNRTVFGINQSLDAAILKPAAHVYMGLVPSRGRKSIGNFIQNLGEPISLLNHGFQQNTEGMKVTFLRFLINSVMGFFGFFDVAKEVGYDVQKQGFMDTLAKAGLGTGPYLVIPVVGPSNLRDSFGLALDWIYDPVGHIIKNQHKNLPYYYFGLRAIHTRASYNEIIESLDKSVDPYARYRIMYSEYRRGQNANIEDYEAPMPEASIHQPTPKPHHEVQ